MEICVMKFGGTSLQDAKTRQKAVRLITSQIPAKKVVVIVSAMGRYPDPYATDTLMSLAKYFTPMQRDRLISAGEMISTIVMNSELTQAGIATEALSIQQLGIITDDDYGQAQVLGVAMEKVKEKLQVCDCLVVPGFQGITLQHETTTLGRGGSDYTAMLIAHALKVNEVLIMTDVDGIYDQDPKMNPQAKRFESISLARMIQLVDEGAKVMQKRSLEYVMTHPMRIWVGSSLSGQEGTWIEAAA